MFTINLKFKTRKLFTPSFIIVFEMFNRAMAFENLLLTISTDVEFTENISKHLVVVSTIIKNVLFKNGTIYLKPYIEIP